MSDYKDLTFTPKSRFYYVDCESLDLTWTSYEDIVEFDRLWNEGKSLQELAKRFNKDLDAIAIHVIDRVRKGKIQKRKNGYMGGS